MVMALGETCWNNEEEFEKEFVQNFNIFRTTSASSGVQKWTHEVHEMKWSSFLYSW
jgi:hypothetical protein